MKSFRSVLRKQYHLPAFPILPLEEFLIRRIAGFPLRGEGADTRLALARNRLPILIVHGEADGFVPYEMGRQNYEAAKKYCDAEFSSVPEADHGMSFIVQRKEYIDAVNRLFAKCGIGAHIEV